MSKFSKSDVVRVDNKLPFRDTQASYRVYTRTISNFVFPPKIKRPRRGNLSNQKYNELMTKALNSLSKRDLTINLSIYSPKMKAMMEKIIKSKKQKIFVYSEFLTLEGIGVFCKILEAFGFVDFVKDADNKDYKLYRRFAVWSGSVDAEERELIKKNFNSKSNLRGKKIKILLATSAGAEGISLEGIRQVLIMEPFWNMTRIDQVAGRASRLCSHSRLPLKDRTTNINIYLSVPPPGVSALRVLNEQDGTTTDTHIFMKAKRDAKLLKEFRDSMKEIAFDCQLNYSRNKETMTNECRTCISTGEQMYPPSIKQHLLPGASKCFREKTVKLERVRYLGEEYGYDARTKIAYDITQEPAVPVSFKIQEGIKKKLESS